MTGEETQMHTVSEYKREVTADIYHSKESENEAAHQLPTEGQLQSIS